MIAEVLRRRDLQPVDAPGERARLVHVTLAPADRAVVTAKPAAVPAPAHA